mgnify:FL=1
MPDTSLPYNEDTTLAEPVSHGYMTEACNEELVTDGAEPLPVGTDLTDWNASYGQIGGGMSSTLADLGTWAASMSGSSLLFEPPARHGQERGFGDVVTAPDDDSVMCSTSVVRGREREDILDRGVLDRELDLGLELEPLLVRTRGLRPGRRGGRTGRNHPENSNTASWW